MRRKVVRTKVGAIVSSVVVAGAAGVGAFVLPQAFRSAVVTVAASCTSSCTGAVTLSATVPNQTTAVSFYSDGSIIATDSSAPFSVSWDTTQATDGSHSVTATASGSAGSASSSSVSVSTSNASAAIAHVWVSTTGNDTTCTRSASAVAIGSASPCATLLKACQIASDGDTVYVANGDYGSSVQDISSCTGHASTVTISATPGNYCPYSAATDPASLPAQSTDTSCSVTMGKLNAVGNTTATPATSTLKNLTFRGIYFRAAVFMKYVHGFTIDHVQSPLFFSDASDTVTISNGDYGNQFDGSCSTVSNAGSSTPDSTNVTISGNIIHDSMRLTSAQSHPDGLFIQGLNGGTITGNVFYRDAVIPLYLNSVAGGSIQNITITNNVIHRVVDMTDTGSSTTSASGISQQGISLGDNNLSNVTVAFNSLEGFIRRQDLTHGGGTGTTSGLKIYANVADGIVFGNSYGCGDNTTYAYNIWTNASSVACDATETAGSSAPFSSLDASPSAGTLGTYTLAAASLPIGYVPKTWCDANVGVCPSTDFAGASRPSGNHSTTFDAGAYENR